MAPRHGPWTTSDPLVQVMRPQMLRPGVAPVRGPMVAGPRPGVIQHSGLGGQGGYGGQVVGPQYGPGPRPMVPQAPRPWPGQQPPGPPVPGRLVRSGPPQHLGPGGPIGRPGPPYPAMGGPPQAQAKDGNIAYNVEHVFKDENGREVGEIPHLIT